MKQLRQFLQRGTVILATILVTFSLHACTQEKVGASDNSASVYQQKSSPSRDGIGKLYMGREISQVMGHQGALWLYRSSREAEEKSSKVVDALNLQPTDVVADIGAGTGYLSFRIAPQVPEGKVLAVDIQPEMLEIINSKKDKKNITNVETVLGSLTNPNLPPASTNIALMVDAYHEFEYPREMMEGIISALKPGGEVVLVEYRREDPSIGIKTLHTMSKQQVRKEMKAVGLVWQNTKEFLPKQHFMVFRKPA